MIDLHDHFRWVADLLDEERRDDETALLWYAAERGDFARLNRTRVRQAGHVEQRRASVRLVIGRCHALATVDLAGHVDTDRPRLRETLAVLRTHLAFAEPDPHLLFGETPSVGKDQRRGRLPATGDALREILTQADGLDLVGVWACGEIARGHASTLGTRRWHSRDHWLFDWSVHAGNDVAVKNSLAGEHWAPEPLAVALRDHRPRLALLSKPARTPPPGRYRAFIAPAALAELLHLLGWGGFGLRAQRTGASALSALARGERRLSPLVTLRERLDIGPAPAFTAEGFELPADLTLVEAGRHANALVSPRSAREFDTQVNSADEVPQALEMAPGDLDTDDPPATLGDGLEIANLWYCNYADRNACRVTGMTRFACFVVEDGRRVAPLAAMRFDDSLYGLLGERLLGVGRERRLLANPGSYGQRSLAATLLPGVLVEGLALVL